MQFRLNYNFYSEGHLTLLSSEIQSVVHVSDRRKLQKKTTAWGSSTSWHPAASGGVKSQQELITNQNIGQNR